MCTHSKSNAAAAAADSRGRALITCVLIHNVRDDVSPAEQLRQQDPTALQHTTARHNVISRRACRRWAKVSSAQPPQPPRQHVHSRRTTLLRAACSAVEGAMASSSGSLPVAEARVDAAVATTVLPAKRAGTSTTCSQMQSLSINSKGGWSANVMVRQRDQLDPAHCIGAGASPGSLQGAECRLVVLQRHHRTHPWAPEVE
jgi:hypothetical protein